jgi:hypothetical protein
MNCGDVICGWLEVSQRCCREIDLEGELHGGPVLRLGVTGHHQPVVRTYDKLVYTVRSHLYKYVFYFFGYSVLDGWLFFKVGYGCFLQRHL